MIKPQGGPDDWRALFHEAGHTEHFAHTSPSLTIEEKRLGDNAVTEGWAMLLEHLTIDPVWLERRLDFPRPHEFAAEGAVQLLWIVRRYCAKLLYELEFHAADDLTALRPRYVELLARRAEGRAERHRLSRRHRRRLLRVGVPARRGPSRRSCGPISASGSATPGSRAARPARCCASCGPRARSRPPTRSSARSPARRSSWRPSPTGSARASPRPENRRGFSSVNTEDWDGMPWAFRPLKPSCEPLKRSMRRSNP